MTELALPVVAAASAVGALVYGAVSPSSQLFGPVVVDGPNPNQIALTFDDGPNPAATPQLLDALASRSVTATFFLIGNFVRLEPSLTREIAAAGHVIGNHSMTHPRLPLLSTARVREELTDCRSRLEDTLGFQISLFRPPYGQRRPDVVRIARELGMTTVLWNVMVGDWNPLSAEMLLNRLTIKVAENRARARSSNIVLHDGGQAGLGQPRLASVDATRALIDLYPHASYVTPDVWA